MHLLLIISTYPYPPPHTCSKTPSPMNPHDKGQACSQHAPLPTGPPPPGELLCCTGDTCDCKQGPVSPCGGLHDTLQFQGALIQLRTDKRWVPEQLKSYPGPNRYKTKSQNEPSDPLSEQHTGNNNTGITQSCKARTTGKVGLH